MKFLIAAFIAGIATVSATCPNLCNGHGNCGASDRCTCFANWQGADCSERVCAYGLAWVDAPASGVAHQYAECSNKGLCDRATGLCSCFDGYSGKGCKRASCPNDCSGHGTCYFIEQLSTSTNGNFQVARPDTSYSQWDNSKAQACVCDPYYEGTDCSLRSCPRGDNILTTASSGSDIQTFTWGTANAAGEFTLTYTDSYGGSWTTGAIAWNAAGSAVEDALKALPNAVIPAVTATLSSTALSVTFTDAANTGAQQAIVVNWAGCKRAGCTPMYDGLAAAPGAVVRTVTSGSLKEQAVCSEHGVCDTSSGLCKCFSGYYNLDCSPQTVLV